MVQVQIDGVNSLEKVPTARNDLQATFVCCQQVDGLSRGIPLARRC